MSDYSEKLWQALEKIRTGMLALADARNSHSQPMTAHFLDHDGTLFFFAPADAQLVKDAGNGNQALFHYTGPGHDLYACIHGTLATEQETALKQRLWSDEVAEWFPDGPDSPTVTLLRFEAARGQVWLNGPQFEEVGFGKRVDKREDVTL